VNALPVGFIAMRTAIVTVVEMTGQLRIRLPVTKLFWQLWRKTTKPFVLEQRQNNVLSLRMFLQIPKAQAATAKSLVA
jgi:hypothetical protein